MDIPEKILSTLTDEQRRKVESARSPEELASLAKEFGYELTDSQLENAAGGSFWCGIYCSTKNPCPSHGAHDGYDPSCPGDY